MWRDCASYIGDQCNAVAVHTAHAGQPSLPTMSITNLPAEVLNKVLSQLDIGSLDAVVESAGTIGVSEANYDRNNPHNFFRSLTPRTTELLHFMGETGTVLTKSRAADYFYPGACDADSDWDFYAQEGILNLVQFGLYLVELGASVKAHTPIDINTSSACWLECQLNGHRVHVVWDRWSPLKAVNMFSQSIAQCIITGFYAISPFHAASSKRVSYMSHHASESDRDRAVRQSYESKGFMCEPRCTPPALETSRINHKIVVTRFVNSGSLVVRFDKYIEPGSECASDFYFDLLMGTICTTIWTPVSNTRTDRSVRYSPPRLADGQKATPGRKVEWPIELAWSKPDTRYARPGTGDYPAWVIELLRNWDPNDEPSRTWPCEV